LKIQIKIKIENGAKALLLDNLRKSALAVFKES
jgi:hypothetical protein